MTPTHCAIPGCIWSYQYAKTKDVACKTIFTVRRPDLAKSDDERKHREQLTNFLLSVRNSNKGDIIKKMLHKESAGICEVHFCDDDIIHKRSAASLRLGASPCYNLPKQYYFHQTPRKLPTVRAPLPKKVHHASIAQSEKSFKCLSENLKRKWIFYEKNQTFVVERRETSVLVPLVSITFNEDASLSSCSLSGWKVSEDVLRTCDPQHSTLYRFLSDVEKIKVCQGIKKTNEHTSYHPLLHWDGSKVVTENIIRPEGCKIMALPGEETCNVCKKLLNSDNSSKLAEVTVAQVVHAVQHVTQRRIMKKNKGGNTTNGKKNAWTSICNDPLPRKKKK